MKLNKYISCVIAIILLSFTSFALDTKTYEKSFKFDSNGSVNIENYKGEINVEAWDKNEIYFYIEIVPDSSGDGFRNTPAKEQLERCKVVYDYDEKSLRIKTDYKNDAFGSNTLALVYFKIKMPASARLSIDDYKSGIKIENLNSDLRLETYKGDVNLIKFGGSAEIETYKGEIKADISKLSGNYKFESYKGEIVITLPADAAFSINFEFDGNGDYKSDFDIDVTDYHSEEGVRGNVNGGGPKIYYSTYKGEIKLHKRN